MSIALNPHQRSVFGETDGDHYKDMQLIEMQRISVCGVPNPSWHLIMQSLHLRFRKHCRRNRKIVRTRGPWHIR